MTANNKFDFGVVFDTPIVEDFTINHKSRERYEGTEEEFQDEVKEAQRETLAPKVEEQLHSTANKQKGFIDEFLEFGAFAVRGGGQGIEELGQTMGLNPNFNIEQPEDFGDQIAFGLGQATTLLAGFVPVTGAAIRTGLGVGTGLQRFFGLVNSSKELTRAGQIVTGAASGALVDAFGFDPKDKNLGNLALMSSTIADAPLVGAAVKKFLAQDDSDSEAVARSKSALAGLFGGAIFTGAFKALGMSFKGVKKAVSSGDDEVAEEAGESFKYTEEEFKEVADDAGKDMADAVDHLRTKGTPEEKAGVSNPLLEPEEAILRESKRAEQDFPKDGIPEELKQKLIDLGNDKNISPENLEEILSTNLFKSKDNKNTLYVLQYMNKIIKAQEAKENVPIESVIKERDELIRAYTNGDPKETKLVLEGLNNVVDNVQDSIPYIKAVRAMETIHMEKIAKAASLAAKNGDDKAWDALTKELANLESLKIGASRLSKATSDTLNAWKLTRSAIDDPAKVNNELIKRATQQDTKLRIRIASNIANLDNISKIERKAAEKEIAKRTQKIKFKEGADGQLKGTVKAGGRKRKVSFKRSETTIGKQITNRIASLKKTLSIVKGPLRSLPKKKTIKQKASPEQLKEIEGLETQIKKVRAERDTLENKFNKGAKEQLALRKQQEKLTADIESLRAGIDPRKGTKTTNKKVATVEIQRLKAERTKLLKQLAPLNAVEKRIKALDKQLGKVIKKRITKDYSNAPKLNRTQAEKDIQKLIKKENDKLKTDIKEADIEAEFSRRAKGQELEEIDKMSVSEKRTRLSAMDRSFSAKTFRALTEVYVNGLLSSGKTLAIVNPVGTSTAIVADIFETTFAGLKTAIVGEGDVTLKEAVALNWSYMTGGINALKVGLKAFRQGPDIHSNVKLDFMNVKDRAISSAAFNMGGNMGKAVDYLGTLVNVPGKFLISTDEAFKSLIFKAHQDSLAVRKAIREVGSEDSLSFRQKVQEIKDNILEHEDITLEARNAADKQTFTNLLPDRIVKDEFGKEHRVPGVAKSIKQFIDNRDPTGISRIFIPFFQTPANIFDYTFQRTPIINRLSESLKAELKSDIKGVRELAEARMGTAWLIWGGLFTWAYSGNFTGAPPRDPNLRKTMEEAMGGRHWNSVNFGEGARTYDSLDPFGLILNSAAIAVNMARSMSNLTGQYVEGDDSDEIFEKYQEVMWAGTIGMAELIKDSTYLKGISELVDVFDTNKGGGATARRIAGFSPHIAFYSSLRRNITRGLEPTKPNRLQELPSEGETLFERSVDKISNEIHNVFKEAQSSVNFGWGDRFAMKNLGGEVVQYPGVSDKFSTVDNLINSTMNPMPKITASKSPLVLKLAELEATIEQPSGLNKVEGVVLSDEQKSIIIDKWTEHNKTLNSVVKGNTFNTLPAGLQLYILKSAIRKFKNFAIDEVKALYPDFKAAVDKQGKHNVTTKFLGERPQGFGEQQQQSSPLTNILGQQ